MADVELRPYEGQDREAVVRLWWESWHSIRPGLRHPHSFDDFRVRWTGQIVHGHVIVVAHVRGRVVGFAAAAPAEGELAQLFVDPAWKRQGIGRRLLAWAQDLMPDGFVLTTLAENAAARAFYERYGLVPGRLRTSRVNGLTTLEYRWTPAAPSGAAGTTPLQC